VCVQFTHMNEYGIIKEGLVREVPNELGLNVREPSGTEPGAATKFPQRKLPRSEAEE